MENWSSVVAYLQNDCLNIDTIFTTSQLAYRPNVQSHNHILYINGTINTYYVICFVSTLVHTYGIRSTNSIYEVALSIIFP